MTTIVEFLTARLDEDQALAELQPPWPWHLNAEHDEVIAEDGVEVATAFALSSNQQRNVARHIARHDPARVLREVEAKRRVLSDVIPEFVSCEATVRNEFDTGGTSDDEWHEGSNMLLKSMAAAYADHPDYDQSWSVE